MKVILSNQDEEFLAKHATAVTVNNERWYHLPYWFKYDVTGWEIVSFEKLPEHVKEIIADDRNPKQ